MTSTIKVNTIQDSGGNTIISSDGSGTITQTASNVGIGTSSPNKPLTVNGGAVDIVANFESTDTKSGIQFTDTNGVWEIYKDATGFGFYDGSTERMRITSSGNVGIGTSSPDTKLHLETSSSGSLGLKLENTRTPGESVISLYGKNSSGTVRSMVIKYDNADRFRFSTANPLALSFETNDTERMRIDSSGLIKGTLMCMYGERNGSAAVGAYVALGNGASNNNGLAMPYAGRILATTINKSSGSNSTTFRLYINGSANTNADLTVSSGSSVNTGLNITFNAGDRLNYQCTVGSDGTVVLGIWYIFDPS